MRIVDDAVLAQLGTLEASPTSLLTHDGYVEHRFDGTTRILLVEVPYLFYLSNLGADDNRRLAGYRSRRSNFFQVTYVGESREQAMWAGEKARALLADERLSIPGRKSWLCQLDESQRVRRDDDAARPDGTPLFYGVDLYSVSITRTPGE